MAKVYFIFQFALGVALSAGCRSTGAVDVGNRPTRVEPLPVKTALKDSAIVIGVPLRVEKRKTAGFRSVLDLQFDVRLTEPVGIDLPLVPNGLVVGPRARW